MIFLGILFLMFLLWIGFHLTGAILMACIWLVVQVPLAALLALLGIVCCCTILLIPVGLKLFGASFRLLIPGI